MRVNKRNGAKSNGPKSAGGKTNVLNDGLSSNEGVIERAGKEKEDCEQLQKEMRELFEPASPMEEMLVNDIVRNLCRLQVARRVESGT